MKKFLSIFIAIFLILNLAACGKSEAVKQTEVAISEIGEIGLFSDDKIAKAEELYNSLSEKEASKVENYSDLTAAREEYNALVYSAAMGDMEEYDYEKALSLLESIPAYKDAKEKMEEARDGMFQSMCASYIFNFIKDGGFYNPSAVRVLDATYADETDAYTMLLGTDGLLYLRIQGTNKVGGTLTKEFVILLGGENDGENYTNDDSGLDYKTSDKPIDVPTINKMLQKYWEDFGI